MKLNKKNILKYFPQNYINEKQINLAGLEIINISTDVFNNLRKLETLNLSNNNIKIIEKETFNNLPKLETLNLSKNKITGIIPGTFNNIPSLLSLDLSKNKITDIMPGTFDNLPNLKTLDLSDNQITNIMPGTFNNLKNLKNLILSKNQIINIIPGTIDNLRNLEVLYLNNNQITKIPVFNTLQKLKNKNLDNNFIVSKPKNYNEIMIKIIKDLIPDYDVNSIYDILTNINNLRNLDNRIKQINSEKNSTISFYDLFQNENDAIKKMALRIQILINCIDNFTGIQENLEELLKFSIEELKKRCETKEFINKLETPEIKSNETNSVGLGGSEDYKEKYLKYKQKYLLLKNK